MAEYSREEELRPARYAARQPILAADETLIGYKLLFRTNIVNHFAWNEAEGASRTAIEVSSLLGLNVLCDNRLAFIPCSRDVLREHYLTFLPADKVVAEIGRDVTPDPAIEEACAQLVRDGYRIALAHFTVDDPRTPLVDCADFLTVDLQQTAWEDTVRIAHTFGNRNIGLLAENVDSRHVFEAAQRAGFHYFQGFFFRKPEMVRTRAMPSNRIAYLRLLQAISKTDLQWEEVEDLIKRDAPLYYRLLRYLNSALFGMRGEVRSVNQALVLMGESELRRWCRLAGLFELSGRRPSDLVLSALVRARFGELLQDRIEHGTCDLFLLGLLSLMDAILQIPMSAVLDGLPLDADSTSMLLDNTGPLLPFFRLLSAIERGAWGAVVRACSQLQLSEEYVAECFSSAMGWAHAVTTEP
jgi:EAL and modified HD-GYP domain-containing signal transduction protein